MINVADHPNNSIDAMVIANPGGQIVLVNAQTERIFGYSFAEVKGRVREPALHVA